TNRVEASGRPTPAGSGARSSDPTDSQWTLMREVSIDHHGDVPGARVSGPLPRPDEGRAAPGIRLRAGRDQQGILRERGGAPERVQGRPLQEFRPRREGAGDRGYRGYGRQ